MVIAALTMVYNEERILPYFLRHYDYVDEIHVLFETDSTDDTLKVLNQAANVVVTKCHIRDGLDDIDKVKLINDNLPAIKADWVYVVDVDEFIFPPYGSAHDFLTRQNCDVVRAAMYQVYRHRSDKDLDFSLPPVPQRIHGDMDLFSTAQGLNRDYNARYIKPIVVRPSTAIRFAPGNHAVEGSLRISPECYLGAHWQMADPAIALDRRMKNRARMSKRNMARSMGLQHWNVTEEFIRDECERHLDDPIIEALRPGNDNTPEAIAALRAELFAKEVMIVGLRNELTERENQLVNITGSVSWRIARVFHRIIDACIPHSLREAFIARHARRNSLQADHFKES